MSNKKELRETAAEAAHKAGSVLMKYFYKLQKSEIKNKSKHEIVTPADLAAEKIILDLIKKKFPKHAILSEEAGSNGKEAEYLWIIDPLDGTTNFSMGNPLFAVSIAVYKNNEPVAAATYVPFLKNIYWAEKGKGAYLNNKKIKVSQERKIERAFLTFCHGNNEASIKRAINIYARLKLETRDLRQIGAGSIECAWVAEGRTEAIIIPGAHPWDVAAGALLVREAGGIVTNIWGQEWNPQSEGIIAAGKNISDSLIKAVKNIK